MSNPLADADSLRAGWADGWPRYRKIAAMMSALPDDRLNELLDAAFADVEDRYKVLVDQMLGRATRLLLDQFTRCQECGQLIDNTNASTVSSDHTKACSLYQAAEDG
jgi:hypothetical protein